MVCFHHHKHLFLRLSFVGHPYTPGFETEIQLAWYQLSCRHSGPTLCMCPPSVDRPAVSGNAAVIVLPSLPPELCGQLRFSGQMKECLGALCA